MSPRVDHFCCLVVIVLLSAPALVRADNFDALLQPVFAQHCVKCHGGKKLKGKVDLKSLASEKAFLAKPELIRNLVEVIDANDMPPDGEPRLPDTKRARLLAALKTSLAKAVAGKAVQTLPIRRLNRFQYNNVVRDLFQLNRDVFPLPEKLMTRHDNYITDRRDRMPDKVNVASRVLNPEPGLKGVRTFPKDLRASHGFDNQANQLTLSPLLLDAYLRLSVSIVESEDFNEKTVGIWKTYFAPPAEDADVGKEVRRRLEHFLALAFRKPVDHDTLDRYHAYTLAKIKQGASFTDAMKKAASAALSSPMFLFRSHDAAGREKQFELASNLSFFLWSSAPDAELLELAKKGELSKPQVLARTIDHMMADPKVERFLDTFPAQWMQLENVFAATPDPKLYRLFSLDAQYPASAQMVLEPLLLFDAVFVEDRPVVELVSPTFGYRSDFLRTWYTTDLKPPTLNEQQIVEQNRRNEERRTLLTAQIKSSEEALDALTSPIRERLITARKRDKSKPKLVDLKPFAAWEFDGNLKDSVGSLDLKAHGNVAFRDGKVVLNRSYLLSKKLPMDLKAKSLEVWFELDNLDQRGGGLMGIQGPGDFFDTIVIGERKSRHWISGSNGFSRTLDFPESAPESTTGQLLHLVMVYTDDGVTTLYRNGAPYGKPFRKGKAVFPKNQTSVIFGLRHLPADGNRYLNVSIDKARFYTRALTPEEVVSSSSGHVLYVTDKELLEAMNAQQRKQHNKLSGSLKDLKAKLNAVPNPIDLKKAKQDIRRRFDDDIRRQLRSRTFTRVTQTDPRFGGVITNAAMLSMTSGPKRTHPIARGAWIIEVIFNDPPPPPPNDVPPLNEDAADKHLTIREKFAVHRENPDCAGCHSRLDPLGFAMENYDITGRWRDKYANGRDVDASGTLIKKYAFDGAVQFKQAIVKEKNRFARAFTSHLLRYALGRELAAADVPTIDHIVAVSAKDDYKLKSIIRALLLSKGFRGGER